MIKRIISFLLVLSFLPVITVESAGGGAYVLIEASGEYVLSQKDAERRLPMASLTKIMTAYTVLQHCDISEAVTVTKESVGIEGSSMYLKIGEKLTVEDLLYGLMLVSGNDAANALAIHVAGTVEKFAVLMNAEAQKLSLKNSSFENPSGLDGEVHYTTAMDLALLTAHALKNETFAKIVSTKDKTIGDRVLKNHNRLLREMAGCIGVKTGFTRKSGRCLVSAVEREGVRLICVTLGVYDDWQTHKDLYSENFPRCKRVLVLPEKEIYKAISIITCEDAGIYNEAVYATVIDGKQDFDTVICAPLFLYPIKRKGDTVGQVILYRGTKKVSEGALLLDRNNRKMERKKSIFGKFSEYILHIISF